MSTTIESRIISTFRQFTTFHQNEVDLFRQLAVAIQLHTHGIFIDETHGGNVCNVRFTSVVGATEICEIADLLIISISPDRQIRATFWQAKKENSSCWATNLNAINEYLDFKGQVNQWDLLCRRPLISGTHNFQPPSDLLSSFSSAAIGSFGVFYRYNSNIEVGHSTAEFVSCHRPTGIKAKMVINGYLSQYTIHGEIITRLRISSFLTALLENKIGALLDSSISTHRWIVQYARGKIITQQGVSSVIDTFILDTFDNFLSDFRDNILVTTSDGLSILIVDSRDIDSS